MRYVATNNSRRRDYVWHDHGNLPAWAENNGLRFWESADLHERKRGTIYREYEIAIPRELSQEQWQPLAQDFVRSTLGNRYPYTVAIHCPLDRQRHQIQPHIHLMYSTRVHDGIERSEDQYWKRYDREHPERGGAQKDVTLRSKERLYEIRREWAVLANSYLEREGHEIRIDHRSLKDQARTINIERTREQVGDMQRQLAAVDQELAPHTQQAMLTHARQHAKDVQPRQRHVAKHTYAREPEHDRSPRPSPRLKPQLDRERDYSDEWMEF